MTTIKTLCVYCGSQSGTNAKYVEDAKLVGQILAENQVKLVYGGGTKGIMGAVAQGVSESGGEVIGIIPKFLLDSEAAHEPEKWCNGVIVTGSMHERKQKMFEHSDGFVALPGGIGTLEELIEIMTWAQLGQHTKPIALLNTLQFWDQLIALYDHMSESGFIHTSRSIKLHVLETPQAIREAFSLSFSRDH